MATNNQANDRYNPPGTKSVDFEYFRFSEVPVGELVWFSDDPNPDLNHAYRKLDEGKAMDTKTQTVHSIDRKAHSYQKI